jgi:SAM-dependent methyltransferase
MLERSRLVPGDTVLDLACGPGGMLPLIWEMVQPGGRVLAGDISAAMLEQVAGLVERESLAGVEIGELEVDWLDIESASIGALLCRFGYMFASDPEAALKEARRVIRPGGSFATAVWDVPERNAYGRLPLEALAAVGMADVPRAGDPGMYRLAEPGLIAELIQSAGFTEVAVEEAPVSFEFASLDDLIALTKRLSMRIQTGLAEGAPGTAQLFAQELERLVEAHTSLDGSITLEGVALVASGRA